MILSFLTMGATVLRTQSRLSIPLFKCGIHSLVMGHIMQPVKHQSLWTIPPFLGYQVFPSGSYAQKGVLVVLTEHP